MESVGAVIPAAIFDTEQGFFAEDFGVFEPRLQGRWTMQMYPARGAVRTSRKSITSSGSKIQRHRAKRVSAGFPSMYSSRNTWFPATLR
jgi:hypothetical protein